MTFAVETLLLALSGEVELIAAIEAIQDVCVAHDYARDIYDFYLLYWAYSDLLESDNQWYWEGATRENINDIIRQQAEQFVRENSKD